ncbi:MAG: hypothetical protein WDO74_14780 [Pseudomonadota bacterium]
MTDRRYRIWATAHFGYPQPEEGYVAASYDTGAYCDRCGIGALQRAPFRFRAEPKARHSHFLQLNWIFDEFFVRPDVRDAIEHAGLVGVSFAPVVYHRSGTVLSSIEQLQVHGVLTPALDTSGLQTVTCKADNEEPSDPFPMQAALRYPPDYAYCGRIKYHWPKALSFRRGAFVAAPDVIKSWEWFGSGGRASRAILVSERFAELVRKHRWRGVSLEPLSLS